MYEIVYQRNGRYAREFISLLDIEQRKVKDLLDFLEPVAKRLECRIENYNSKKDSDWVMKKLLGEA